MSRTVKLPDPVYDQASEEAEARDVSRGAVIESWMHAYHNDEPVGGSNE